MLDSLYVVLSAGCLLFASGYLVTNMIIQTKARKKLEENIKADFIKLMESYNNREHRMPSSESEYEALISLLRREIEDLKDPLYKQVLHKTLDRKNFYNQKRFAFKIFSDTGFTKKIHLQGT